MNPYYTDLKNIIQPLTAISTFVRTNSASWEESADILPTVTNFFSGNTVKLSGLSVIGNTQINTDTFRLTGVVLGKNSQVSFNTSTATGEHSFAAGRENTAQGTASFAEGYYTFTTGSASHAEGFQTRAEGIGAHAEGGSQPGPSAITKAVGNFSHTEGTQTQALGDYSHAQGQWTIANGEASHAAGSYVAAQHARTWAWRGSTGTTRISTTRADQFMVSADGGVYIPGKVGIGTDNNNNALTVVGTISSTGVSVFNEDLRVTKNLYSNYLEISGAGTSSPTESVISNHSSLGSLTPFLIFRKSRAYTTPQNNDSLGAIDFYGINSYASSTSIRSEVDGDYSTTVPGRITFYTAPTGFTGLKPRLTIKQDGKIGIGTTDPNHNLTVVGNISSTGAGYFTSGYFQGGTVELPDTVNFNGSIYFSNQSIISDEIGFIDDNDNVLAIKRIDGSNAPTWEYGGGYPSTATLRVSSDSNTQTRFDINSLLVVLPNLPTSSTGLPVGALWNDTGTVKIVT